MYFIKNFFSHLLAFIMFVIILFLVSTGIARSILTRNQIIYALEDSGYMEEAINEISSEYEGMEDVWEYIEIEDIINNYIADKILYELKRIDNEPKIDIDLLNERIAEGIELYIDDTVNEYTGGLSSIFENAGFDISDKISDYINNNTEIDLENNEIITEEDLEEIYKEIDKAFEEVRENKIIFKALDIIYNDTISIILVITLIVIYIIISLINFNAVTGLLYTIAPVSINALLTLILFITSLVVKVSGGIEANIVNYFIKEMGIISFKYFIILILITIIIIFSYFIGKYLSIFISHKTGKTTLDTFFDDYNREEVIREIEEKENINKEEKE
ncbi:MAG: hypothetical protein IJN90_02060 [Bacilli bacterium]|nr:hypothetical protein [Bacilli bacterium]